MGRTKKGEVRKHFVISNEVDVRDPSTTREYATCKFCGEKRKLNVTRMQEHIKKCTNSLEAAEDSDVELVNDPEVLDKNSNSNAASSVQNVNLNVSQAKISSFFDKCSPDEQILLDRRFARAVYHKGLPFDVYEDPFMKTALKMARSAYKPPTAYKLAALC